MTQIGIDAHYLTVTDSAQFKTKWRMMEGHLTSLFWF